MIKKYSLIILLLLVMLGCTPITPEEMAEFNKIMERQEAEEKAKEYQAKRARVSTKDTRLSMALQKKLNSIEINRSIELL